MGRSNFEGEQQPTVTYRKYSPCAAAMRLFVKLLSLLVIITNELIIVRASRKLCETLYIVCDVSQGIVQ